MQQLLLVFISIILFSCGQSNSNTALSANTNKSSNDFTVALTFINEYALFCSSLNSANRYSNWIKNYPLLSDNFKKQYYALLDSAEKIDPELGLGFDPIFNAQDFPDSGFVILNSNPKTGLVTVKGKDCPKFIVVLKVITQNNQSLVDGCGIINVPANNRSKR